VYVHTHILHLAWLPNDHTAITEHAIRLVKSIKHMDIKIKPQNEQIAGNIVAHNSVREYFLLLLIFLIAFASFGLGRLSVASDTDLETHSISFTVEDQSSATGNLFTAPSTSFEQATNLTQAGKYVASVNGSKYHFPWCSGAQRINEENKIWFDSTESARAAGYTPAANCKGLE
jgi:hypothetical protein